MRINKEVDLVDERYCNLCPCFKESDDLCGLHKEILEREYISFDLTDFKEGDIEAIAGTRPGTLYSWVYHRLDVCAMDK